MDIKIKKILDNYSKDDVKLPLITEGNACYDFYAPAKFVIYPGEHGVKLAGAVRHGRRCASAGLCGTGGIDLLATTGIEERIGLELAFKE